MGNRGKAESGRKRMALGFGALLAFGAVGFLLAPQLVRHEPKPAPAVRRPSAFEPIRQPPVVTPRPSSSATSPRSADASDAGGVYDCMIQPGEVVDIGSAITGRIESIHVERGDYVASGQVVAKLDSAVEMAAVRVARANADRKGEMESSKASLHLGQNREQRGRELFKSKSLSLDVRENLETEARLAAAKFKEAEENHHLAGLRLLQAIATLERRTITSPISGYVMERLMAPGEVVDEETILRIAQVDPLRVAVILPVQMFGRLRPGDSAQIVPEAPLDQPRAAEVSIVDPVIDGPSATFGALLSLPNPDHALPAGLRCKVRFSDS